MSMKSYAIAFQLGAKMDSSLRTAFATANKSMSQLSNNSKTLSRSTGSATQSIGSLRGAVGSVTPVFNNMAKNISSGVRNSIISPFRTATGVVSQYAGALGLLSGTALAGTGMARLSAIENSQVSLKVLMGDAKTARAFLDEVLAFAKKTPFAFPDLAETSRNLIAFGMDKANVIPTMQAIGDAAAASGKGTEGFRQIASAFGAMQVSGTLSMGEVNRLADAGIPALKILANSAGVSVEAMKKNISSGSMDAVKAIESLVTGMQEGTDGLAGKTAAMAGLMEEMKDTWIGSVDSLKSSISSTMATIIEPAKPHIQAGMKWFGDQFKKLPKLISFAARITNPIRQNVVAMYKDVAPYFKDFKKVVTGTFKGVMNVFKGDESKGKDLLSSILPPETASYLITVIGTVKSVFSTFFSTIKSLGGNMGSIFMSALPAMMELGKGVQNIASFILPYITQALGAVLSVVQNVGSRISDFWKENGQQIMQAVKNVMAVVLSVVKFIAPVVIAVVKMIWGNIRGAVDGAMKIIFGVIKIFASLFTGDWAGVWEGAKQLFLGAIQFIWNAWNLMLMGRLVKGIAAIAKTIFGFFKGLGPKLATNVQYYYHLFVDGFYRIGTGILRAIGNAIGGVVNIIRAGVTNFVTVFQTARTFGVNIFLSIVSAIRNMFSNIFGFIGNTISSITGAVVGRVSAFIEAIKAFIRGLWGHVTNIFAQIQMAMVNPFNTVRTLVQEVVSAISGFVSGMFGGVLSSGKSAINGLIIAANAMIGGLNKIKISVPGWVPGIGGNEIGFNVAKIPMLAAGGITTGPTLAMIGEGAEQEAVLPLSKLESLLRMPGKTENQTNHDDRTTQIVYNPVFQVPKGADQEALEQTQAKSFEEFKRWMKRYEDEKRRRKF